MTNINEIDDALSAAINSLAAAQSVLRKSAPPKAERPTIDYGSDVLRKALAEPQPSMASHALDMLDDLERRATALEAARVAEAVEAARQAELRAQR